MNCGFQISHSAASNSDRGVSYVGISDQSCIHNLTLSEQPKAEGRRPYELAIYTLDTYLILCTADIHSFLIIDE